MSNPTDGVSWSPSAKGPSVQELKALAEEAAWLNQCVDWPTLCHYASSFISRFTSDPTVGDNIVRELYDDMLRLPGEKLRGLRNPKAYAKKALRRRLLNWIERSAQPHRLTSLPDHYENSAVDRRSPEVVWESRQQIIALLAELPQDWRAAFVLTKVYGFSVEEAAKQLSLSVDAVKKRTAKAVHYIESRPTDTLLDRLQNIIKRKEQP